MEVTCHYGVTCRVRCRGGRKLSRLFSAPLFDKRGDFMGIFVGDCRLHGPSTDRVFKLALSGRYIESVIGPLMQQLSTVAIDRSPDHKRSDASDSKIRGVECSSKEESSASKRKRGKNDASDSKIQGVECSSKEESSANMRKRGKNDGNSECKQSYSITRGSGGRSAKSKSAEERADSQRGLTFS